MQGRSIKMRMATLLVMSIAVTACLAVAGWSQIGVGKFFDQGQSRLTLTGGWGQAFNQDYVVVGAGAGYFLTQGWELGVDGESWLGNSPKINKLTPETRYIFQGMGEMFPYVGAFYRRTFYEDIKDANSAGARFGAYLPMGQRSYFGVGGVFERQFDCNTDIYDHCSVLYPEFSFTVSF